MKLFLKACYFQSEINDSIKYLRPVFEQIKK